MKNLIRHTSFTLPIILTSVLLIFLPSCDNGVGLFKPGRTWVATNPIQCLGNPWEADWLERHDNDYQSYPRDSVSRYAIIREYYSRLGVEITDVISIVVYEVVCTACSCPTGDALYLHVRDEDVGTMTSLGFRVELPHRPAPPDTTLKGVFYYTGFDSSWSPIISGTLTFVVVESTSVSGIWQFEGREGYGPQVGMGAFEGWIDGKTVSINLNPGWADNNVFLTGELKEGRYQGTWEYVTFVGPVYTGSFSAVKRTSASMHTTAP